MATSKKKKVDRRKFNRITPGMAAAQWTPGQSGNPGGRPPGKTILTRIKEMLLERAPKNDIGATTRQDVVAHAYIRAMEGGSFPHFKEIFEREEGKVPNKIANADGTNIKAYMGMPIDDDPDAP